MVPAKRSVDVGCRIRRAVSEEKISSQVREKRKKGKIRECVEREGPSPVELTCTARVGLYDATRHKQRDAIISCEIEASKLNVYRELGVATWDVVLVSVLEYLTTYSRQKS